MFRGSIFTRTGDGLVFWDYLVDSENQIVGVELVNFDVNRRLAQSDLLTAAQNVIRNEYGFRVVLGSAKSEPENDGAQAFGSSLFCNRQDCLLLLPDWHGRDYGFSLTEGLVDVCKSHPEGPSGWQTLR